MTETNGQTPSIARLTGVDLRAVWGNEARNFTPWVLDNADRLSEVLGFDLEIEAAEHRVGNFSLDLIGTVTDTGERVIIENQLETTNHEHLGQILTYAGGTDPKTIIWIAKQFREEHAAALQWLNENTDEEINFYGVQVSAVQIDDSRPAALFDLVVRPNTWEKRVRSSVRVTGDQSGSQELYSKFWLHFNQTVREAQPGWNSLMRRAENRSNWMTFASGIKGVWFGVNFAGAWGERTAFRNVKALRSELYFGTADAELNETRFHALESYKGQLEELLGFELSFEELPRRKACRVAMYRPGSITEEAQWSDHSNFFIESQLRLRNAVESLGGLAELLAPTD